MKTTDQSYIKRDCFKVYQKQGIQLKSIDQKIEIIFEENNDHHLLGNAYLQHKKPSENC